MRLAGLPYFSPAYSTSGITTDSCAWPKCFCHLEPIHCLPGNAASPDLSPRLLPGSQAKERHTCIFGFSHQCQTWMKSRSVGHRCPEQLLKVMTWATLICRRFIETFVEPNGRWSQEGAGQITFLCLLPVDHAPYILRGIPRDCTPARWLAASLWASWSSSRCHHASPALLPCLLPASCLHSQWRPWDVGLLNKASAPNPCLLFHFLGNLA